MTVFNRMPEIWDFVWCCSFSISMSRSECFLNVFPHLSIQLLASSYQPRRKLAALWEGLFFGVSSILSFLCHLHTFSPTETASVCNQYCHHYAPQKCPSSMTSSSWDTGKDQGMRGARVGGLWEQASTEILGLETTLPQWKYTDAVPCVFCTKVSFKQGMRRIRTWVTAFQCAVLWNQLLSKTQHRRQYFFLL